MSGTIAIIDYGSGNLRSAAKAFQHVVADNGLSCNVIVTDNAHDIANAARLVLPGQGAFGDCMKGLTARPHIFEALVESVQQKKVPFFGICVGMQLLADQGLEHGLHDGLGWIGGKVVPLAPSDPALKIPHMGWNSLCLAQQRHPALQHIFADDHFYFVHSFMVELEDSRNILATTEYGGTVTAVIGHENILGVQFHPEKSQQAGLRLLRGFLEWKP